MLDLSRILKDVVRPGTVQLPPHPQGKTVRSVKLPQSKLLQRSHESSAQHVKPLIPPHHHTALLSKSRRYVFSSRERARSWGGCPMVTGTTNRRVVVGVSPFEAKNT